MGPIKLAAHPSIQSKVSDIPEAKASGHLTFVKVLRVMAGPSWERFVSEVHGDSLALLERTPLPIEWIPYRHFPTYLDVALRVVFAGQIDRIAELGRRCINADLSTIHRIFAKLSTPKFILGRAAVLFGCYVRNAGTLKVVDVGPRKADVVYAQVPYPSQAFWAYQLGSVKGAMEATSRNVTVHTTFGGGTQSHCTFRATW